MEPIKQIKCFFISISIGVGTALAADAPKSDQVFDFEADVIEGERERPDLFLQLGANPNAESILYLRKDFNDFHESSRKWRPGLIQPKESAK